MIDIKNIGKKLLIYIFVIVLIANILLIIIKVDIEQNNKLSIEEITNLKEEINNISNSFNETIVKINEITEKNSTYTYDPTTKEAYDFILKDKTNEKKYDDKKYNCAHYSRDVNNNAENYGIRCAYVKINFNYRLPHAIVAFNTIDQGLLFFEPQTDETFELNKNNTVISYEIYW